MYLKVNTFSHFKKESGLHFPILVEFQKMRVFARWRSDLELQVYILG